MTGTGAGTNWSAANARRSRALVLAVGVDGRPGQGEAHGGSLLTVSTGTWSKAKIAMSRRKGDVLFFCRQVAAQYFSSLDGWTGALPGYRKIRNLSIRDSETLI